MWTWLKDGLFWCIQAIYNWCGDWGLAIIIITIIFRALIYPITAKQVKSTYAMQKIQPYIKEVQEKYADDQAKMNEEMQKIYAEHKFNPLGGCLPLLLQMPIFIILYQTLLEKLPNGCTFYHLIPNLTIGCNTVFGWNSEALIASIPYIILLLLFAITTFIPMIMQGNTQRQAKMMGAFMSIFMLWVGWSAPAGVMLYWVVSALIGIAQQQIIQAVLKKEDEKVVPVISAEPVQVSVERKVKKPKPTKKSH